MDAANISSMSSSGPRRTRIRRFTRPAHDKAINGFTGGIKAWSFVLCPMCRHKTYMNWLSSLSKASSEFRFSTLEYGLGDGPGRGTTRRGGNYCLGFAFETEFGISFA